MQCIYSESKVGKVQGTRARKRKPETDVASIGDLAERRLPAEKICDKSTTAVVPDVVEDAIVRWDTDIQNPIDPGQMSFDDSSDIFSCFNTHQITTSSPEPSITWAPLSITDSDLSVPSLSFGTAYSPSDQDLASHSHQALSCPPVSPLAPTPLPRSDVESRCILACTSIITSLENYIIADLKALDIVLDIAKKTGDRLEELMRHQQDLRTHCCIALFSVILHQVVCLLENGCSTLTKSQDQRCNNAADRFDAVGSSKPLFGFGTFQMDPEEQRAWQSQVVVRELQHIERVLQQMNNLSREGDGQARPREFGGWGRDLGRRISTMNEMLQKVKLSK